MTVEEILNKAINSTNWEKWTVMGEPTGEIVTILTKEEFKIIILDVMKDTKNMCEQLVMEILSDKRKEV